MPQGIFPNGNESLFKKGHKLNIGRTMSNETKIKISNTKKGKKSPWVSERNRKLKGKLNPNYKGEKSKSINPGGIIYTEFIKNNPYCTICNNLVQIIHHIDRNRKNNVVENLQPFCYSCHAKIHKRNKNFKNESLEVRQKLFEYSKTKPRHKGKFIQEFEKVKL